MTASRPIYKVVFHNQGKIYEIYARDIYQSDLLGFIEVEEFLFDETSGVLVDPGQERLKNEFKGVKRSYIPVQSIERIDEVEKEGTAKMRDATEKGNVRPFPSAFDPHRNSSDT